MTEQIGDQKTAVGTASMNRASESTVSKNTVSKSAVSKNAASKSAAATADPTDGTTAAGLQTRHAVLRYTTLRLALFLVALLLVWGVAVVFNMDLSSQLSKLTLLAVALLLSSAASFVVLSKYRDAMSAGIVSRTQRLSKKFDDAASFEDEDEDE
jgi:Protein of unknown function (DUF4229)